MTQLHVALLLARLDGKEKLVLIVLACEQLPERVLTERLRPDPARAILRAVRRLHRDHMIEVAQGRLCLTNPENWPSHRLDRCELQRAGQLVSHAHDDDRSAAMTDAKKVHPAILAAKEAARRKREASQVPAPKLHQIPEDDDDVSWLGGDGMPDESKPKPATSCPLADDGDTTPAETKCDTCANALDLLSSPLPGLAMWAKQHLSTCVLSPKGPGWSI
jgi:hypothetical protein